VRHEEARPAATLQRRISSARALGIKGRVRWRLPRNVKQQEVYHDGTPYGLRDLDGGGGCPCGRDALRVLLLKSSARPEGLRSGSMSSTHQLQWDSATKRALDLFGAVYSSPSRPVCDPVRGSTTTRTRAVGSSPEAATRIS